MDSHSIRGISGCSSRDLPCGFESLPHEPRCGGDDLFSSRIGGRLSTELLSRGCVLSWVDAGSQDRAPPQPPVRKTRRPAFLLRVPGGRRGRRLSAPARPSEDDPLLLGKSVLRDFVCGSEERSRRLKKKPQKKQNHGIVL